MGAQGLKSMSTEAVDPVLRQGGADDAGGGASPAADAQTGPRRRFGFRRGHRIRTFLLSKITGAGRTRPGEIIIVRHGRPSLAREGWINAREWDDWWARYNESGLRDDQLPPEPLLAHARLATHLFASPLRRAVETAEHAMEGRPFVTDPMFVEAPLPAPPLPDWLRLPTAMWGGIARFTWYAGYSGGGESHRMARRRAKQAANRLIEAASDGGTVMLCAHGWFNRMIKARLIKRWWFCAYDGGDNYWAWRRFLPPR